jgi:acyl transferase domain-containing protein
MSDDRRIAVIGLAARFPGAADADEFWDLLVSGRSGITAFSRDELIAGGVDPAEADHPWYVPAAGDVAGIDQFDAEFFGCTERAAGLLDPQHRLFLECAWTALEDACCDPASFAGQIGVFAGQGGDDYRRLLAADPALAGYPARLLDLSCGKDFLATRTAYSFGLTGPALTVQTACSTSLVAVHLACQSLLNGECDVALAGAAALRVPQGVGYLREEGMSSSDGHCRAFDAAADGSVPSGGVGVVVLKPLADALAAGDPVRACLLASAVNNDGSVKVGFTAPGVDRQAAVIEEALTVAGVDAASIGYVEAHGTATPLGDPIEIAALTRAFGEVPAGSCWIGSVKSNIGHADVAAGMAGLIKTVLALEHGEIPPSLDYATPNPEIDFAAGPFRVAADRQGWPREPRRAGVSCFGLGGTNAHLVLEQAPPLAEAPADDGPQLLVLSARTPTALATRERDLARLLDAGRTPLPHVARTLRHGRAAFAYRSAIAAADPAEAVAKLSAPAGAREPVPDTPPGVVFLYPGGAAQHPEMTARLYRREAVFREAVDDALEMLGALGEPALCDLVRRLVRGGEVPVGQENAPPPALVSLFVVEYALTTLWRSYGVNPAAVLGHSSGDYAAACAAGVLEPEDALRIVLLRARWLTDVPAGRMVAVPLSEPDVRTRLATHPDLTIAAVNGPRAVVVSGARSAADGFEAALLAEGIDVQGLNIDAAGHSPLVEPVLRPLGDLVGGLTLSAPRVPVMSATTGAPAGDDEITRPAYWVRHLREPVRFRDAVRALMERGHGLFLEVGPGRTLSSLARRNADGFARIRALPSLPHGQEERDQTAVLLESLGALWAAGVPATWPRGGGRSARLPTYPYDRQTYWAPQRKGETTVAAPTPPAVPEPAPEKAGTPSTSTAGTAGTAGKAEIRAELQKILADFLGGSPDEVPTDVSFLEQGADSLVLVQVAKVIETRLGVKIPFRQLVVKYPTVDRLAERLLTLRPDLERPSHQPPEEPPPVPEPAAAEMTAPAAADPATADPRPAAADTDGAAREVCAILRGQLDVLNEQLRVLGAIAGREESR